MRTFKKILKLSAFTLSTALIVLLGTAMVMGPEQARATITEVVSYLYPGANGGNPMGTVRSQALVNDQLWHITQKPVAGSPMAVLEGYKNQYQARPDTAVYHNITPNGGFVSAYDGKRSTFIGAEYDETTNRTRMSTIWTDDPSHSARKHFRNLRKSSGKNLDFDLVAALKRHGIPEYALQLSKTGDMRPDQVLQMLEPTFWFDEEVQKKLLPEMEKQRDYDWEDVPGQDIPGVPRPANSCRTFSMSYLALNAQIATYRNRTSINNLMAFYRTNMRSLGWRTSGNPENYMARFPAAKRSLLFTKDGTLCLISMQENEETGIVTSAHAVIKGLTGL